MSARTRSIVARYSSGVTSLFQVEGAPDLSVAGGSVPVGVAAGDGPLNTPNHNNGNSPGGLVTSDASNAGAASYVTNPATYQPSATARSISFIARRTSSRRHASIVQAGCANVIGVTRPSAAKSNRRCRDLAGSVESDMRLSATKRSAKV